jgi:predicted nucleotidyltransferase
MRIFVSYARKRVWVLCISFLSLLPLEHHSASPRFPNLSVLIYSLPERYASIRHSTLVLATIGRTLAKLEGQLIFAGDVVLDVWKLVDFEGGRIRNYSYEIYRAGEKMAWYDPFEHPHIPALASPYPHHKHVPPDIRHHRVSAPGISFVPLNLPTLIEEIEGLASARHVVHCLPRNGSAAVFGSVARAEARPDSDTDILIELDPAHPLGLFAYASLKRYITDLVGEPADVVNRNTLKARLRDAIIHEAVDAF